MLKLWENDARTLLFAALITDIAQIARLMKSTSGEKETPLNWSETKQSSMNAEARNQVRGIQGSFKSLLSPTFARLFVVDKEWNLITYLPEKETEQEWPKSTTMTARPSLVNCRLHKWTNWKRKCSVFWICHESGVAITPAYLTKGMESMALRARADAYATLRTRANNNAYVTGLTTANNNACVTLRTRANSNAYAEERIARW